MTLGVATALSLSEGSGCVVSSFLSNVAPAGTSSPLGRWACTAAGFFWARRSNWYNKGYDHAFQAEHSIGVGTPLSIKTKRATDWASLQLSSFTAGSSCVLLCALLRRDWACPSLFCQNSGTCQGKGCCPSCPGVSSLTRPLTSLLQLGFFSRINPLLRALSNFVSSGH